MSKSLYRKKSAITIEGVLEQAFSYYQMVRQWSDVRDYGRAANYSSKCESLIELLEVHLDGNCGVSCFKNMIWINAGGGCRDTDYKTRIFNILDFCHKNTLVSKSFHPNPEAKRT